MKQPLSIKQILVDLITILPQIKNKHKGDSKYIEIINFLTLKDYLNNEDIPYPTFKQIAEETSLNGYQIRKQLKEMYAGMFDYPYNYSYDFSNVETYFSIEHHKKHTSFKVNNLKYLPKIGENIQMRFLEAKFGINIFHVDEIQHEFISDEHIVRIYLKGDFFNSYWHHRKHKAFELKELSFMDKYELYEFQMKEKLGLRF